MPTTRDLDCSVCGKITSHAVFLATPLESFTGIEAACQACGNTISLQGKVPIEKAKMAIAMGEQRLAAHPKGAHRGR